MIMSPHIGRVFSAGQRYVYILNLTTSCSMEMYRVIPDSKGHGCFPVVKGVYNFNTRNLYTPFKKNVAPLHLKYKV